MIIIENLYRKFKPNGECGEWFSLVKCESCQKERSQSKFNAIVQFKNKNVNYCKRCSMLGTANPFYGKKHSEQTIKTLKEKNSGINSPFFGKKRGLETRQKMSLASRGRKLSKESKLKISKANKGRKCSEELKQKYSIMFSGKNNPMYGKSGELSPNWNPNLTDEERNRKRNYIEYDRWSRAVKRRDSYTCQITGQKGNVRSHHLNSWSSLRISVMILITALP